MQLFLLYTWTFLLFKGLLEILKKSLQYPHVNLFTYIYLYEWNVTLAFSLRQKPSARNVERLSSLPPTLPSRLRLYISLILSPPTPTGDARLSLPFSSSASQSDWDPLSYWTRSGDLWNFTGCSLSVPISQLGSTRNESAPTRHVLPCLAQQLPSSYSKLKMGHVGLFLWLIFYFGLTDQLKI